MPLGMKHRLVIDPTMVKQPKKIASRCARPLTDDGADDLPSVKAGGLHHLLDLPVGLVPQPARRAALLWGTVLRVSRTLGSEFSEIIHTVGLLLKLSYFTM
jgi:hypothetical protein